MGVAGVEAALVMGRSVVGFGADGVKSFAVKTAPTGRGTCTEGGLEQAVWVAVEAAYWRQVVSAALGAARQVTDKQSGPHKRA